MILKFQQQLPCGCDGPIFSADTIETTYDHAGPPAPGRLHYFLIKSREPDIAGFALRLTHREAQELHDELHHALHQPKGLEPCPAPRPRRRGPKKSPTSSKPPPPNSAPARPSPQSSKNSPPL